MFAMLAERHIKDCMYSNRSNFVSLIGNIPAALYTF